MEQILAAGGEFTTEVDSVYAPAEDTFVLIDAIRNDSDHIINHIRPLVCMEIGCGSGAVITSVAKTLGQKQCLYMATDINDKALLATKKLMRSKGLGDCIGLVKTDITTAVDYRLGNKIDLLIFNPPFCPSEPSEVGIVGEGCSFKAGAKGRQIQDRFLPKVSGLLSPKGVLYMTAIKRNNINEIRDFMRGQGFQMSVAVERQCPDDTVYALKFWSIDRPDNRPKQ